MSYSLVGGGTFGAVNLVQRDEVRVEDYNGDPAADFRVLYKEQDPDFIVPKTGKPPGSGRDTIGSPEAGLTNQQNWDKYNPDGTLKTDPNAPGLAIAGAIAPCLDDTTRPEVGGFTCPLPPSTALSKGDANGDGTIDLRDVLHVIDIALGRRPAPAVGTKEHCAADADSSGGINVADAVRIIRHILGIEPITEVCS